MLGPQQMPPQGARALVGALLGGFAPGPEVAATLDESQPGAAALVFVNEGRSTAAGLSCLYANAAGTVEQRLLGDLAPGAVVACPVDGPTGSAFRCVWACGDERGRRRLWSYDGRSKRIRRPKAGADEAFFRATYG